MINRLSMNNLLAAAVPNQGSVAAQLTTATTGSGATWATKSYVDTQDATFAAPSYYTSRDALNIPTTARGTVAGSALTGSYYGVASTDSTGTIPPAQLPNVGAGYLVGPWGTTATVTGSTGSIPLKIADWNIGTPSVQFRPWVYLTAFVTSTVATAHPIIEIRIADSTTAPTYAASTLVGMGEGRTFYTDYHAISTVPVPDTTGESYPALLPTSYHIWLTAWLYDVNGGGSNSVTLSTGGIASAAAFLWRGSL